MLKQHYMIQKLLKIILIAICFLSYNTGFAITNSIEHIQNYQVEVLVNTERSLTVTEKIDYNMPDNSKRGIFRDINKKSVMAEDGKSFSINISDIKIKMNGQENYPFVVNQDSQEYNIKIGDADVYLDAGLYNYEIEYKVTGTGAIRQFADIDEVYWNAIGHEWNIPIEKASAKLILPKYFDLYQLKIACYTGIKESTDKNCSYGISNLDNQTIVSFVSDKSFGNKDGFTIAVGFPLGLVADQPIVSAGINPQNPVLSWTLFGLQIGILVFMLFLWYQKGRDKIEKYKILVQYDAPFGLKPAEVARVKNDTFSHKEISATIIDLARRGYLRIREFENTRSNINQEVSEDSLGNLANNGVVQGINKLFDQKFVDYEFICLKADFIQDTSLAEYEKLLLSELFIKKNRTISLGKLLSKETLASKGANLVSISDNPEIQGFRERVSLELLTKKRSLLYILEDFKKLVLEDKIQSEQIMSAYSTNIIKKYALSFILINILFLVIGVFLEIFIDGFVGIQFVLIQFGLLIIGSIIAYYMPKHTAKGLEALYHILGYKKYIEEAEKRRLEFQEKERIFFDVLPYAMALGVVKKWTNTFKDLALHNPDWYESSQTFQIAAFSTSLYKIDSSLVNSSTSPSSGSGGGGSSGGGSGGGGGGSW